MEVALALQAHAPRPTPSPLTCSQLTGAHPFQDRCSPQGDLAEPQSSHSENIRGSKGLFPSPAGGVTALRGWLAPADLVLHRPSPTRCWCTDPSPLATDPKPGFVPHPRSHDEDHRAHRHQGWQPPADAEGLPHRPGTAALWELAERGGDQKETGIPLGVSQVLRPQLLLPKPGPVGLLRKRKRREHLDAEFASAVCEAIVCIPVQVNTSCNVWGNSTEYRRSPMEEDLSRAPQLVSVPQNREPWEGGRRVGPPELQGPFLSVAHSLSGRVC